MKLKLYTELEVRKLLNEILMLSSSVDDAMDSLTPIELPSDEEIRERAENSGGDDSLSPADEYENGAKWMKEQILNQKK